MGLRKKPVTLLGYARVSRGEEQSTRAQVRALKDAGATRIFQDTASGGRWDRPELQRLLDHARPGDVVVVWKLDRLSRSLKDLLNILERLEQAGGPRLDHAGIAEHFDHAAGQTGCRVVDAACWIDLRPGRFMVMIETTARPKVVVAIRLKVSAVVDPNEPRADAENQTARGRGTARRRIRNFDHYAAEAPTPRASRMTRSSSPA